MATRNEADKLVDNTVESILKKQGEKKASKRSEKKAGEAVDDDEGEDNNVAMFDSVTLKKHVDAVMKAIDKKDQANADVKSAYEAADKAGVPIGELKFVIKNRKKRMSEDFKANVNIMNEMLGDLPLFSFREKAEHALINHH